MESDKCGNDHATPRSPVLKVAHGIAIIEYGPKEISDVFGINDDPVGSTRCQARSRSRLTYSERTV